MQWVLIEKEKQQLCDWSTILYTLYIYMCRDDHGHQSKAKGRKYKSLDTNFKSHAYISS